MSAAMQRFDDEETAAQNSEKYLTFLVDNQYFALPIRDVTEIITTQTVTQMPEFPVYVKGIINLRGKIVPLVDIRLRFHKAEREYDEHTSVVVVSIDGIDVGFIVDAVDEVLDIDNADVSPAPRMGETSSRYITGVGKVGEKIVLLLDSSRLLNESEISDLSQAI